MPTTQPAQEKVIAPGASPGPPRPVPSRQFISPTANLATSDASHRRSLLTVLPLPPAPALTPTRNGGGPPARPCHQKQASASWSREGGKAPWSSGGRGRGRCWGSASRTCTGPPPLPVRPLLERRVPPCDSASPRLGSLPIPPSQRLRTRRSPLNQRGPKSLSGGGQPAWTQSGSAQAG